MKKNNLKSMVACALIALGVALPATKANANPITQEYYDTGSGFYGADFQTTNPVNSFSYSIPINFSDRNLILENFSPLGYNCNALDNFGQVKMNCRAIPGDQTSSGFLGFNLDLQALGWGAGTSMQDLVNLYGTSPQGITFETLGGFTEKDVLQLPSILYASQVSSVPVPGSLYLLVTGLVGFAGFVRGGKTSRK